MAIEISMYVYVELVGMFDGQLDPLALSITMLL